MGEVPKMCGMFESDTRTGGTRSLFSLTLNRDLKGGAVTLVLGRHLTPVATSITRDHFDDLHFISVDLGRDVVFRGEGSDAR